MRLSKRGGVVIIAAMAVLFSVGYSANAVPIYEPIHNPVAGSDVGVAQVVTGPNRKTLVFVDNTAPIKVKNDTGWDIVDLRWQIPTEQQIKDALAEPDPKKREFVVGTNHPVQPQTDNTKAGYNTGNQAVRLGDAGGDGQVGDSTIFATKTPAGAGPTDKLEFSKGKIKKGDTFTDDKSKMKDGGAEIAFKPHWAAVSYSIEASQPKGQGTGGTSSPSLSFDSQTNLLTLTPFVLSSAYISPNIGLLDVTTVDPIFSNDPILGATLSFSPFELAYSYVENGVQKFFFQNPGGVLQVEKGGNIFLTASLAAGMIFDPSLMTPFFAPLNDIFLNNTLGSTFIDQLGMRLLNPNELPFDLFISPSADFLQATGGFTTSANVIAKGGIAQNGVPVPAPSSVNLLAIGMLGWWLVRKSQRRAGTDMRRELPTGEDSQHQHPPGAVTPLVAPVPVT